MKRLKLFVCVFYGLLSIAQTLNSRFLFRSLHFNFFSLVFLIQRIVIILINRKMGRRTLLPFRELLYILPYAFIMCSVNILSSFCVTIMPLAAFMAFKKFVVLFVLIVGIAMHLPNNFKNLHYACIGCILLGGLMIGEKEMLRGELMGYAASLFYTLCEAMSLQYSLHLYERRGIGPQGTSGLNKKDLMVANSLLSIPYYLFLIVWQQQHTRVMGYLSSSLDPLFLPSFAFSILLAFSSEYTANTISMKISPFEKASVSNIKDLLLTIASIRYFKDFEMTLLSEIGIFFCLSSSVVFSLTLIEKKEKEEKSSQLNYQHIEGSIAHSEAETELFRNETVAP